MKDIFPLELWNSGTYFLDKNFKEINFKSHLNSVALFK